MTRGPTPDAIPKNGLPDDREGHILDYHLDASKILAPAAGGEGEGYTPLPLRNLEPGTKMPFNVYIKCKTKDQDEPQFTPCCAKGQVFRRDWHRKLKTLKVPWVYFPLQETAAVLDYLHHNLKDLKPEDCCTSPDKAAMVLDAMLLWIQHFFLADRFRTGPKLEMALDCIDLVFEFIKSSRAYLSLLMEIKHHDDYLFKHSLNVCTIGLAFVNYLGLAEQEARFFGVGALLHDLGMTQVPRLVLQKPGPLEEEEMKLIMRHPLQSCYMIKHLSTLPKDPIVMVQQHHENGDGSGYPLGLSGSSIHPWAKILRIIDSYESVTAGRPWRAARPPKETLWDMRHEWEKSQVYDSAFLRAFIKFLGGAN
ncbi:MAG: HD domain-containing phosphohydrolase [Thermodesulfobacteriota bacterium]